MDHYNYLFQKEALRVIPRDAAQEIRGRYSRELLREPPIGGWNTRDALDNMPPTDAVTLTNWFPDLGFLKSRGGSLEWCDLDSTGGNAVETLLPYYSGGSDKLIACCDSTFYEVDQQNTPVELTAYDSDEQDPLPDERTITRSRWQGTCFDGKLIMTCGLNGEEPLIYDASRSPKLYTPSYTGDISSSEGTIIGCHTFKNRVYYWTTDTQDFWYTDLQSAAGNLTKFPLSRVGTLGGSLIAMHTWTHDGGSGPDDYAVFVLSSGQCVVYQGTSPASVGNWSIVGIYDIGIPVGVRCMTKFGGDLIVMTSLDWVKMTEVVSGFEARQTRTKISGAAQSSVRAHKGNFGWQAMTHPAGKKVIFNIPTSDTTAEQHVMNIVTGAWCKFEGWNATAFASFQDELYYAGKDGVVYRCDYGESDSIYDSTAQDFVETPIYTEAITAWDRFDEHPNKNFIAMDVTYRCEGAVAKSIKFVTDYAYFGTDLAYPDAISRNGITWTDAYLYTWYGYTVGYPTFSGTGLNDMLVDVTYSGQAEAIYEVKIVTTGGTDYFQWRKNGGAWSGSLICGSEVELELDLIVMFDSNIGHTIDDTWTINITEVSLLWADPEVVIKGWDLIYGYGRVFAYQMKMALKQTVEWLSNQFLYNVGDRL